MLCGVKKKRWYINIWQETVFAKSVIFAALNLAKWNILVVSRIKTKKYFGSTGEGNWNRPF